MILEVLSILEDEKHKLKGKSYEDAKANFPLDEFDFYSRFRPEHESFLLNVLRSIFVFATSIVATTVFAMVFLVWFVSGYKQAKYFREITRLYSEFLPENTNLNEQEDPSPRPVVYDNQREIIGHLVRGITRLLSVAREIREDYEDGVFTITHHRHLLENVYYIKDIFHLSRAE